MVDEIKTYNAILISIIGVMLFIMFWIGVVKCFKSNGIKLYDYEYGVELKKMSLLYIFAPMVAAMLTSMVSSKITKSVQVQYEKITQYVNNK